MNNTISKKDFVSNVECFLGGDKFESIYDLKIPADKSSVLIYNTDDLWLSKDVFDLSLELARKFRNLENTDLWNPTSVKTASEWLKILVLADKIKFILKNVEN